MLAFPRKKRMLHIYYVGLGSNFNAEQNIRVAGLLLSKCFCCECFSPVIETEGIGLSYQCWYLNQMVRIVSPLCVSELVLALKSLEKQVGRKKHPHNVAIDLDLVEADGVIVHKDYDKYPFLARLRKLF